MEYQPLISCPSVIGVASCRCVRPILTISLNFSAFARSVLLSRSIAGSRRSSSAMTPAICIAAGKVSLELCERLTSSLGWVRRSLPRSASRLFARFAITSFTFMFVCVPLPVCQTTSGKCSSHLPATISSTASPIIAALAESNTPSFSLALAAAFLI
ncbi:hypothetical protein D3C71_1724130 [compost metagenome]